MRPALHKADFPRSGIGEWAGWFVARTRLTLAVDATDNGLVAKMAVYFVGSNTTREGMPLAAADTWGATFEIDFWAEYAWG